MNILIVNTSENIGGAAIAAKRLVCALNKNKVKVQMLVRDKNTNDFNVTAVHQSKKLGFYFAWERIKIWIYNLFSLKNLFAISIASTGCSITNLPEFKEADIIHLHWLNQGFISLQELKKIISSGKPIVWTLHDMWPITGICHHARNCDAFTHQCGYCPFLKRKLKSDLSTAVFLKKKEILQQGKVNFVGCSQWMAQKAKQSKLTINQNTLCIPNPIDTNKFKPTDKASARSKLNLPKNIPLILFGATKATDKRKGVDYFIKAVKRLALSQPNSFGIVLYGKDSNSLAEKLPFPTYSLKYINSTNKLIQLYNAVDVFVIPSLEENLPNSIMESMSCGTPCVGFNVGGIPEMINHLHNGYVAEYKSEIDLANGITWTLYNNQSNDLGKEARRKVVESYREDIVAQKYINLYNQIL